MICNIMYGELITLIVVNKKKGAYIDGTKYSISSRR